MQRFFGRRPTSAGQSSTEAEVLAELAESKQLVEKREAHLQRKLQAEIAQAIEHKKHDQKKAAIACLQRKKMIETELDSLVEQKLKLATQEHTLHQVNFTSVLVKTEQKANSLIRAKVEELKGPDGMQQHRERTEETLEDAYELLSIASQPVANPALDGLDDDEMLAELDALEEAEKQQQLEAELAQLDEPGTSGDAAELKLPNAPTSVSKEQRARQQKTEEELEYDRLEASMLVVDRPMPMLGMAVPTAIAAM